jgi:citronellol/citronellal dehydrogenase
MERLNLIRNQLDNSKLRSIWVTKNTDAFEFLPHGNLKGKTIFVTGASRGIGLAIALKAAKDGANIVIVAKTQSEQKNLPGTIYSAAEEIKKAGGNPLPIACNIRDENAVKNAVELAVKTFGGIDILVNNASAINLSPTEELDMKRYDLMQSINSRGTFLCSKYCLPYLKKAENPHILMISPPIGEITKEKWFRDHVAYSIAKFGMSLCVLGMSGEFKKYNIGVNALWPRTSIATAAVNNLLGGEAVMKISRSVEIMADSAYVILTSKSDLTTGNFFIDDEVLASEGVTDFSKYNADKNSSIYDLQADFFV